MMIPTILIFFNIRLSRHRSSVNNDDMIIIDENADNDTVDYDNGDEDGDDSSGEDDIGCDFDNGGW